jgi:DNA modification methylase
MARSVAQELSECPVCGAACAEQLGRHLRAAHGEAAFRKAVISAKAAGAPDAEIGGSFGISFTALQQIVTEACGANVSTLKRPKCAQSWEPRDFREQSTTVWSFKQRGKWATHDGRYRGNWSPHIPRNVILKYSRPGDLVLDYFVGGGTSAVEAKLLGRRCAARDINPAAVQITRENLAFSRPRELFSDDKLPVYEPDVSVGDARELTGIQDASVDLICAHPPYAGIIKYTANVAGDLSGLDVPQFLAEMGRVAAESMRVLKPGGTCAILVGDARKSKHVVPIGFETLRVFLAAGFELKELVIKRQHNCKTTGFWYAGSVKHNFLLLAHEYLPIVRKPGRHHPSCNQEARSVPWPYQAGTDAVQSAGDRKLETTTAWLFPFTDLDNGVRRNLIERYAKGDAEVICFSANRRPGIRHEAPTASSLAYVEPPGPLPDAGAISRYCSALPAMARQATRMLRDGGTFVADTRDVRVGSVLCPVGLMAWEALSRERRLALREIVIVAPQDAPTSGGSPAASEPLRIVHRYLLVYRTLLAGAGARVVVG